MPYITETNCSQDIKCFLQSWWRWDAVWYVEIAHYGYQHYPRNTAFFPLFPFLIRVLGTLFGGSLVADYTVGVVLANICFYGALVLFYQLVYEDFDHNIARNALFYLAFAPYSIFFFAAYPESLLLLLSLATFYFLRRGKTLDWWLAGLCGFFATLTHDTGIVLLIPFLVLAPQKFGLRTLLEPGNFWKKFNTFLPMALIPAGLLVYMLYLLRTFGNPLFFSVQHEAGWHQHFSFPWVSILDTINTSFQRGPQYFFQGVLGDLFFTLVPLVALIVGWRRLPLHYNLYSLTMLILVFCSPVRLVPGLESFDVISAQCADPVLHLHSLCALEQTSPRAQVLTVTSLIFFVMNTILFVDQIWLA